MTEKRKFKCNVLLVAKNLRNLQETLLPLVDWHVFNCNRFSYCTVCTLYLYSSPIYDRERFSLRRRGRGAQCARAHVCVCIRIL